MSHYILIDYSLHTFCVLSSVVSLDVQLYVNEELSNKIPFWPFIYMSGRLVISEIESQTTIRVCQLYISKGETFILLCNGISRNRLHVETMKVLLILFCLAISLQIPFLSSFPVDLLRKWCSLLGREAVKYMEWKESMDRDWVV